VAMHRNLFVAKLPRTVTDADLFDVFHQFNPCSAKVMLNTVTGRSKGYGFVFFASESEGLTAFHALNGTCRRLHGRNFTFTLLPSQHDGLVASAESNALVLRNIPLSVSDVDVQRMLAAFGAIKLCTMRPDYLDGPIWIVYVEYDSVDAARFAVQSLHCKATTNGLAPILAKFASSHADQYQRLRFEDLCASSVIHELAKTQCCSSLTECDVIKQQALRTFEGGARFRHDPYSRTKSSFVV